MTVLITMAGLGTRFSREGYTTPKYKIIARGRSLLEWSLLSLNRFYKHRFIFACLNSEDSEWILNTAYSLGIKDCVVHKRNDVSNGQAETAFDALTLAPMNQVLWIYNIDTYVAGNLTPDDIEGCEGSLPVFYSVNPGMSYVRFNQRGEVVEIAEKKIISSWATVGLYGFSSSETYKKVYLDVYGNGKQTVSISEQYIAPLYQQMLEKGSRVLAPKLDSKMVQILGTPKEVLEFDSDAIPPIGAKRN